MIAALAAQALNHVHGADIERLVKAFTSSNALDVTAVRYLKHLKDGLPRGEAAGRAATALMHDWADAVLNSSSRGDRA